MDLFGGSSSAGLSYIYGYSGTVNANVKEMQDGMRECLRLSLEMNLIRSRKLYHLAKKEEKAVEE